MTAGKFDISFEAFIWSMYLFSEKKNVEEETSQTHRSAAVVL